MARLFLLISLSLLLLSCREQLVNGEGDGVIYINSTPTGAEIYIKGDRTFKVTPDSLADLAPGVYQVDLKLTGYPDAGFNIQLSKGEKRYINYSFNNDF